VSMKLLENEKFMVVKTMIQFSSTEMIQIKKKIMKTIMGKILRVLLGLTPKQMVSAGDEIQDHYL